MLVASSENPGRADMRAVVCQVDHARTVAFDISACVFTGQIDKSRSPRHRESSTSSAPILAERKRDSQSVARDTLRVSTITIRSTRLTDDRGLFSRIEIDHEFGPL